MDTTTTSTLTSKGQILIPKAMRDALGIKPRQPVHLKIEKRRIIIDREPTVDEMCGFLQAKGKPLSKKELKKIVKQATLERYEKILKRSGL